MYVLNLVETNTHKKRKSIIRLKTITEQNLKLVLIFILQELQNHGLGISLINDL